MVSHSLFHTVTNLKQNDVASGDGEYRTCSNLQKDVPLLGKQNVTQIYGITSIGYPRLEFVALQKRAAMSVWRMYFYFLFCFYFLFFIYSFLYVFFVFEGGPLENLLC